MEQRLNQHSIETIKKQIALKQSQPYFATQSTISNIITDMDHFPYTRWFRGVSYYPDPIVMEREVGWRPLHNDCYNVIRPVENETEPNTCFEAACSTVFPCKTTYSGSYSERQKMEQCIDNSCIVKYR